MVFKRGHDVIGADEDRPMMPSVKKVPLNSIKDQITCSLCKGYFIDATTIIECLHTFCRSCIVRYLETHKYCPVCDVLVHKTRPLTNIRPDKTMQDIVYKLVPRLYQEEMCRRRDFYISHPEATPTVLEEKNETLYDYILSPEDNVCVSLNYYGSKVLPRYLKCPVAVTVGHLRRLIAGKYDLTDKHHVDVYFNEDCLYSYLTLMEVAYIYNWRRFAPLKLTYRIFENRSKRPKLDSDDPNSMNNNNWKEVQLRISENGEISVTGIDDDNFNEQNVTKNALKVKTKVKIRNLSKKNNKNVEVRNVLDERNEHQRVSGDNDVEMDSIPAKSDKENGRNEKKIRLNRLKRLNDGENSEGGRKLNRNLNRAGKKHHRVKSNSNQEEKNDCVVKSDEKGDEKSVKSEELRTEELNVVDKKGLEEKERTETSKKASLSEKVRLSGDEINKMDVEKVQSECFNVDLSKKDGLGKKDVVNNREIMSDNQIINDEKVGEVDKDEIKRDDENVKVIEESKDVVGNESVEVDKGVKKDEIDKKDVKNDVKDDVDKNVDQNIKKGVDNVRKDVDDIKKDKIVDDKSLKEIKNSKEFDKFSNLSKEIDKNSKEIDKNLKETDKNPQEISKVLKIQKLTSKDEHNLNLSNQNQLKPPINLQNQSQNKRKIDEKSDFEPQSKQPTILNHTLGLQNLSNNHPLKKHSMITSQTSSKWSEKPNPPCYSPRTTTFGPIINVPKPQTSVKANKPQTTILNSKVPIKNKPSTPIGYKTLRDPPRSWNPQLSRPVLNRGVAGGSQGDGLKNVRPPKFFKIRNNMPRYLGNPASGVKPMYQVHDKVEKDDKKIGKEKIENIKKHSIVKIDPKTLKPISERAPETSNLTRNLNLVQDSNLDLKINTSSVSIFNPLKLQQTSSSGSPKSSDRKSPKSPNKILNFTPPNPFVPNLQSPTISPNQFLFPGPFNSYDPRMMAAYHSFLYGQTRLPFHLTTTTTTTTSTAAKSNFEVKNNYELSKLTPSTSAKSNLNQGSIKKGKEKEKSLQNAVEKLTQSKLLLKEKESCLVEGKSGEKSGVINNCESEVKDKEVVKNGENKDDEKNKDEEKISKDDVDKSLKVSKEEEK
ncbi:uncharacterized protein [Onthophagus taurus]|uniref:uncharacterized protein n=1 Tax=Onthophagus taurus TaxID=166361 RepID=UPI0039BE59ED